MEYEVGEIVKEYIMDVMDNRTNLFKRGGAVDNLKTACEYFSSSFCCLSEKRQNEFKKRGNILGSYIITDINGEVYQKCRKDLSASNFTVKTINLIEPPMSSSYNPLSTEYLECETDIISLASVMVDSIIGDSSEASRSHPFDRNSYWRLSAKSLLAALISYLILQAPPEEQNLGSVFTMLENNKRTDEQWVTSIDVMFEKLAKEQPDCLAVKQYAIYKNTDDNFINQVGDYLSKLLHIYNSKEILYMMALDDDINIRSFMEKPSVLFVIIPDVDDTFRPLVKVLYYQLISVLRHESFLGCGKLPVLKYI